jgi:hypothetical protein
MGFSAQQRMIRLRPPFETTMRLLGSPFLSATAQEPESARSSQKFLFLAAYRYSLQMATKKILHERIITIRMAYLLLYYLNVTSFKSLFNPLNFNFERNFFQRIPSVIE